MFIKYIPLTLDATENEEKGFLDLARFLSDTGGLSEDNYQTLHSHLNWVDSHVPKPPQRQQYQEEDLAITWWKLHPELYTRLNDVKKILEAHDVWIEVMQTENPGKIVYEDDYQVIALPN